MREDQIIELRPKMIGRYRSLHKQISAAIRACDAEEYVEINTVLLGQCIIDYFEDIEALKKKEGIQRVNESKIYAYQTYWFLKRRPIQIVGNVPHETREIFINEIIAVSLIIPKVFEEMGVHVDSSTKEMQKFADLLFYNFKYRLFTQLFLELMVEGILASGSFVKDK